MNELAGIERDIYGKWKSFVKAPRSVPNVRSHQLQDMELCRSLFAKKICGACPYGLKLKSTDTFASTAESLLQSLFLV
jgi:hypothetical protein